MKKLLYVLAVLVVASMILTACGGAAATPATEAPVVVTEAPVQATEAPVATEAPAATEAGPADPNSLPRAETLYFNGQQWGPVTCWNPYVSTCNNAMAIAEQDNARVTMFETPYLYNMLDGQVYPLLADGA